MEMQVSHNKPANRVCLKCGKDFPSKGPGNRICKECARVNAKFGSMPEALIAKQRGSKWHNGVIIDDTADVLPG